MSKAPESVGSKAFMIFTSTTSNMVYISFKATEQSVVKHKTSATLHESVRKLMIDGEMD